MRRQESVCYFLFVPMFLSHRSLNTSPTMSFKSPAIAPALVLSCKMCFQFNVPNYVKIRVSIPFCHQIPDRIFIICHHQVFRFTSQIHFCTSIIHHYIQCVRFTRFCGLQFRLDFCEANFTRRVSWKEC